MNSMLMWQKNIQMALFIASSRWSNNGSGGAPMKDYQTHQAALISDLAAVNEATSVMTSDTGPANRIPQLLGSWHGEIIKTDSLEAREGPSLDQGDRLWMLPGGRKRGAETEKQCLRRGMWSPAL